MGMRMLQDQPTQAMTAGKQHGTRKTLSAPAHPPLPLSRVGRILGCPRQAQSKGLWPRRSREGQPCPGCSHASLQSLYPQILLAPCPDPPPPYIAPNCKQVSLQERWHHPSTYFSIVRGPSLYSRMEKRRRLLTPFCPGTLESTSDSTTDICVSLCVSRDIWHTTFKGLGKQYLSWWELI